MRPKNELSTLPLNHETSILHTIHHSCVSPANLDKSVRKWVQLLNFIPALLVPTLPPLLFLHLWRCGGRPHGPPKRLQDDFDSSSVRHSAEAISLAEAVMGNDSGSGSSSSSRGTVGKLQSNYVVIDFVDTHAPSRLMQCVPAAAQCDCDAFNITNNNSNNDSPYTTNNSVGVYTDQCFPKVVWFYKGLYFSTLAVRCLLHTVFKAYNRVFA